MLKLTFPNIMEHHQIIRQGDTMYLHKSDPLLIKGNHTVYSALFEKIIKGDVTFAQENKELKQANVHAYTTELTPNLILYRKQTVSSCLSDAGLLLPSVIETLALRESLEERIDTLSKEQQLLLQTYILLHRNTQFLVLIRGNWNLYAKTLTNKLKEMLEEVLQKGCYVLISEDSSNLLSASETWDVMTPPSPCVTTYVEETVKLPNQLPHLPQSHHKKGKWILRGVMKTCYVVMATLLIMITCQMMNLYTDIIKELESVLTQIEHTSQYVLLVEAKVSQTEYNVNCGSIFTEVQERYLKSEGKDAALHPIHKALLTIYPSSARTTVEVDDIEEPVVYKDTSSYEVEMQICTYSTDTNEIYGIPDDADREGVYISPWVNSILRHDLTGKTLKTQASFPISLDKRYAKEIRTYAYEPNYAQKEIALPIIAEANGFYYGSCAIWMEETLFQEYQDAFMNGSSAAIPSDHPASQYETVAYRPSAFTLTVKEKEQLESLEQKINASSKILGMPINTYRSIQNNQEGYKMAQQEMGNVLTPVLLPIGIITAIFLFVILWLGRTRSMLGQQEKPQKRWRGIALIFGIVFCSLVSLTWIVSAQSVNEFLNNALWGQIMRSGMDANSWINVILFILNFMSAFHLNLWILFEYMVAAACVAALPELSYGIGILKQQIQKRKERN